MFLTQPDLYNVFIESLPLYGNIHFQMNKDEGSLDAVIWPLCCYWSKRQRNVSCPSVSCPLLVQSERISRK